MSNIQTSPALTREQYVTKQLLEMPVLDITIPVLTQSIRIRVYDLGRDQLYIREDAIVDQNANRGYFRRVNGGWQDVAHYMANLTVTVINPKDVAFVTSE